MEYIDRNEGGKYLVALVAIIMAMFVAMAAQAQTQGLSDVEIIRDATSYYYVWVNLPDTTIEWSRHNTEHKRDQGMMEAQLAYPTAEITYSKNEYGRLRATVIEQRVDTVAIYEENQWTRNIGAGVITSEPDTTGYYSLYFDGYSEADQVRVATNCYDGTHNERFSVTLTQVADRENWFHHTTPDTLNCRGIMTYWKTATVADTSYLGVDFMDVGHTIYVGRNSN